RRRERGRKGPRRTRGPRRTIRLQRHGCQPVRRAHLRRSAISPGRDPRAAMDTRVTYDLPEIEIVALCHDCRKKHVYRGLPAQIGDIGQQWLTKHQGHRIEYLPPRPLYTRRLLNWIRDFWCACPVWAPLGYQYGHNADVKVAYVASA